MKLLSIFKGDYIKTVSLSPMSEFIIVPIRNYEKMKNLELKI
jgi:hypothetical protein